MRLSQSCLRNRSRTKETVTGEVVSVIEAMGKTPLQCNDSPGFVSNRILCPMINEAIITLDEGVADAEAIDGIMKLGMNHPIGPLALADLIGLDTVLNIMRVLHDGLDDDKYAPSPLLVSMVNDGKLIIDRRSWSRADGRWNSTGIIVRGIPSDHG